MDANELRNKYLKFFESKSHAIIPSASLVPEGVDTTTLFTGSGMQPLVPYLSGQPHPLGKRLVNSQLSFRAEDIEEVGDNRHTTFFEMLGNWSLGDYFKKEQLSWLFEFLTKEVKLDPKRLYVTVFAGNDIMPKDTESIKIWQELFKTEEQAQEGIKGFNPKIKIYTYGAKKNWWSRAGLPEDMPAGEIGGPDSETFFDFDPNGKMKIHENSSFKNEVCHVNCDCCRFLEIGNSVFMEYKKKEDGSFDKLPQQNVDFGGGLERILVAKYDVPDIFKTDLFIPIIEKIEEASNTKYKGNEKAMRIISDHIRASTFILSERVAPFKDGSGYILRRLIRRAICYGKQIGIKDGFTAKIAEVVIKIYAKPYPELGKNQQFIFDELAKEEVRFSKTLERGLKEFEKMIKNGVSCKEAFNLYQTYGFPIEIIKELAQECGVEVDEDGFAKELKKHQELSRTAAAGKFKAGLADDSEQTIKCHTATHLMLAGLRKVLGGKIEQRGSNITSERIRFDFTFDRKVTPEEVKQVEEWVNERIKAGLEVKMQEMTVEEAQAQGALAFFRDKYPEKVKVFTIFDPNTGEEFSKEICSGPHVENISTLGGFKITKEGSSSQGVRRIRAVLE